MNAPRHAARRVLRDCAKSCIAASNRRRGCVPFPPHQASRAPAAACNTQHRCVGAHRHRGVPFSVCIAARRAGLWRGLRGRDRYRHQPYRARASLPVRHAAGSRRSGTRLIASAGLRKILRQRRIDARSLLMASRAEGLALFEAALACTADHGQQRGTLERTPASV
jgi:hypothetical protein